MTTIEIPNGWDPRFYQLPIWNDLMRGEKKRADLVWHRRCGKDSLAINFTAAQALTVRTGVYWHMLPTASQARKVVWNGVDKEGRRIIDQAFPPELRKGMNATDMRIELQEGSIWQLLGSDNYDSHVGANPVGVVFSEWALADPRAWDFIRPILLENGGWAIFIYTPRGRNHAYRQRELRRKSPNWISSLLTIDDTGLITAEQVQQEVEEGMPPEIAQQEFYCSFDASLQGSYFGALMVQTETDKRIRNVPYDPLLPVETWWDLGIDDSMAIWFVQRLGNEIRCIRYLEHQGEGLPYYVAQMIGFGYTYSRHILPHDGAVRELGTGKSRQEVLEGAKIGRVEVVRRQNKADQIQAARLIIPRTYFDEAMCARGLDCLRHYQREFDERRQVYLNHPLHDWSSHGCDAYMTGAMGEPNTGYGIAAVDDSTSDWNTPLSSPNQRVPL